MSTRSFYVCVFLSIFAELALADSNFENREIFFQGHRFYKREQRLRVDSGAKTFWFNQSVDHFNPSDTSKFQQRYFINDTFYKPGGPVFLMVEGESEAVPDTRRLEWQEYAEKLGAYCIQLEHRYYGKSRPTPDISVNNMKYLTSEQALADVAAFVAAKKLEMFPSNKWVAFGCSYGGSLAAWARLKYPHLIDMVVSTSAPLEARLNFKEYYEVVTNVLNNVNSGCAGTIQKAVERMEQLLKTPKGWKILQKKFNMCEELNGTDSKQVSHLFQNLALNFAYLVQLYGENIKYPYQSKEPLILETLCDIMTNGSDSNADAPISVDAKIAMDRYAEANTFFKKIYCNSCCTFTSYGRLVNELRKSEWNAAFNNGPRQWMFQACNEFGFYQTSDDENQPFGKRFDLNFAAGQCEDIYGSKYSPEFINKTVRRTNTHYGGKDVKVTKVIFVNGSFDPWHPLGITEANNQTSDDNRVIFIEGTSHCANALPVWERDSPQLTSARIEIEQQLKAWLQE